MEALVIIGLVGNIVQFVDFSGKLISKSVQFYRSSDGALVGNSDIETVTNHLLKLNKKLKDAATTTGDGFLENLCTSCSSTAAELLTALDEVKVKGKHQKWKSIRKALQSVWNKEDIAGLERRLASFREELNLHVIMDLKDQFCQFKREQSDRIKDLDSTTQIIVDAIEKGQDIFQAAHQTQLALMRDLHGKTTATLSNEHETTRTEIIHEIRRHDQVTKQEQYLATLPYASDAAFNSRLCEHEPQCHPKTRIDILQKIMVWSESSDSACIFWLSGMAGTGKSTIARTVSRQLYELKRLGASFFFSKGRGDRSHAGKLITSIAVQLANKSLSLKHYISEAIAEHSDIASQTLRDQWNQLVLGPLSKMKDDSHQSPLIIVIDALDECGEENDIRAIPQLLVEARALKTVLLRIFVTSRPEIPIRHSFIQIQKAEHEDFILHNIPTSIVDDDISIFLEYNLGIVRRERALAIDWPGEQTVKRLVQNAGGLFIWAATACRFIGEGKIFAIRRLSLVLQGDTSTAAPEQKLNEIYIAILTNSISVNYDGQEKKMLYKALKRTLGTIVILFSSLPAVSLAGLLHIAKEDINETLLDLHSILEVPEDQCHPIRLHHPSFRDFLLDKQRCRDLHFWVDEKEAHHILTENCLRLMFHNLKQDICNLRAPGALARHVDSTQIERSIPAELQYACLHWVQHLQRSKAHLVDDSPVHIFLHEHLLHWFEALSLLGKVSEGVLAIISLESIVTIDGSPRLHAFIHHTKRFGLNNRPIIEEAPLQTYCSALVFAPEMCIVRRQYKHSIPNWVRRLPKTQEDWGSLLQTLEGHSGSVDTVAFSPDGKVVASGSDGGTVRLWDSAIGDSLQIFKVNTTICQLSFSEKGPYLETDIGSLSIQSFFTRATSLQPQPPCNVFVRQHWVTREKEKLLWLPSDYRAACTAIRNNILVSGHASGRVTFIEFSSS